MKSVRPSDLLRAESLNTPLVSRRSLLLGGAGAVLLSGPALAGYAGVEAAEMLDVTRYKLTPRGWPSGRSLSIAVIADLHAGGPNMGIERIAQVVDTANGLQSDVVAVLGDFFATHRFITEHVPHDAWAEQLARLRAPLGVYTILGNHDWWYDIAGVRKALAKVHLPVMENDLALVGAPGSRIWIAGLGDQIAYWLGPSRFRGVDDLPGTLKRVTTDDPVILLVHEPDIFVRVPERVSLTIAGHTHGGQIRVPFVPPYWAPSAYGARFAYGHIVEEGRHLIVSGGLGCSKVPMRLGVPPEVVRITLGA